MNAFKIEDALCLKEYVDRMKAVHLSFYSSAEHVLARSCGKKVPRNVCRNCGDVPRLRPQESFHCTVVQVVNVPVGNWCIRNAFAPHSGAAVDVSVLAREALQSGKFT